MLKKMKKLIPFIGCVLAVFVLAIAVYYNMNASSFGNRLGMETGSLVGRAIGSWEGITKGREEGTEAGKAFGLSAEDTRAEIVDEIKKISNLEVLVASVKITDFHSIGDKVDYAALYLIKGEVVFSVDLSQATIDVSEDGYNICLPKPHGELYIDQGQVDKLAEYQKHYFSGSAESGYDAYLNTMAKLQETSVETLDNYDSLIEVAKESAESQVKQLVLSLIMNNQPVVNVEFDEEN